MWTKYSWDPYCLKSYKWINQVKYIQAGLTDAHIAYIMYGIGGAYIYMDLFYMLAKPHCISLKFTPVLCTLYITQEKKYIKPPCVSIFVYMTLTLVRSAAL